MQGKVRDRCQNRAPTESTLLCVLFVLLGRIWRRL